MSIKTIFKFSIKSQHQILYFLVESSQCIKIIIMNVAWWFKISSESNGGNYYILSYDMIAFCDYIHKNNR